MDQVPRFIDDDREPRVREIDMVAREVHGWWGKKFVAMKRIRVKTWKGTALLAFLSGVIISLVWLVSLDIESESGASVEHPAGLLEVMRLRGCVADGLLSGYGGDTRASVDLINRSECLYLHRALESWLNPPDFELARRVKRLIEKPDVVYGMFISEALNTEAEYYSSLENRVLKFSDMCVPESVGFWGKNTCKASFASDDYRAYVRDVTRKAMDLGIRSFLFGQIAFQDADRKGAPGILEEMRQYAGERRMKIAIGAQTNTITSQKYLELFDYIEGGVGIAKNGDVEEKPCASRYDGWCWALLWHKKYSEHANMVLLHLDWSGIEGDDMAVFAGMDSESRAKALRKLHEKFNTQEGKTGFLFPFLATLYDKNGGCYGAKKSFYSPDNRYSCKDEDVMNELLRRTTLPRIAVENVASLSGIPIDSEASLAEGGKKEERDDANFEDQNVPERMVAGRQYEVSVTMKNTGTTEWTDEKGYRLGSQNPQDNAVWGGRVFIFPGNSVKPKKKITFGFTVTAPEGPGMYEFQWQMLREGQAWFGEMSKNKTIEVVVEQPREGSEQSTDNSQQATGNNEQGAGLPVGGNEQ